MSELDEIWFLKDRAIRHANDDRLNHLSVATTLVAAIRSAQPPCMLGLLAEFGKGKSSTTNLAAGILAKSEVFDTVTVSADKHAGTERARNLVHGVAGKLQEYDKIRSDEVEEILRPLRQATQVSAKDPTDTPANRFMKGRYSCKGLAGSLWPFAVVAFVAGLLALWQGAPASTLLTLLAASPVVVWVAAMTFGGTNTPMGSLLTPASLTDQKPRAEAADEIEEVFGRLIDHHSEKRKRRLVVFVDDIDRLAKDDLLDALRALRSLQSVPRGHEPVFVISCNESILRAAVGHSTSAPASDPLSPAQTDPVDVGAYDEDGVGWPHVGQAPGEASSQSASEVYPGESVHEHPALAFIDKLLTVRVQMPPTMSGDMRRFAHDIIPQDHPLRSAPDVDLESVIGILIHDSVDEPRSAIRLFNRFIASYLLAREREDSQAVAPKDITHHTDVLAQLCVLLDEFPAFHAEVTDNTVVLQAASKVARRTRDLSASEKAALDHSAAVVSDADEPSGYRFVQPSLRRYLTGTVRRVTLPDDLGPIVYFAATPGGRVLGAVLRTRLISGIRSGDPQELADALDELPSDKLTAAGEEIAEFLLNASAVDAETFIASVAPNLARLESGAEPAADGCADLLDRAEDDSFEAEEVTAVIDQTSPGRHDMLTARLIRHDDEAQATNRRFIVVGRYLVKNRSIRSKVEPTLAAWLESLAQEGGWSLAQPWLDVAEHLDQQEHADLLQGAVTAMCRSIGSESTLTALDADRLVDLAEVVNGHDPAAPSAAKLSERGPITESAFVRLWAITDHDGEPDDALYAATAAADADVADDVRRTAVGLVVRWAEQWKDATQQTDEESEPTPITPRICDDLAEAVRDPAVQPAFYGALPVLAATIGAPIESLFNTTADVAVQLRDDGMVDLSEPLARALLKAAATIDVSQLMGHVTNLLEPLNTESDPDAEGVQMTLRLIPHVAGLADGPHALTGPADAWSNQIRTAGVHDDRTRIEGFRALNSAEPGLVDARAEPIVHQIEAHITNGDDTPGRVRVLATFPWPEQHVPKALSSIDAHWDSLDADYWKDAFRLATRAPENDPTLTRFHARLVAAVEKDPHGELAAIAAEELRRLDEAQVGSVFNSSVGRHANVTQKWLTATDGQVATTLAQHAATSADADRLLDALPDNRRSGAAAEALQQVATTSDVPLEVINAVAGRCEDDGLGRAATTAVGALDSEHGIVQSSLGVLVAVRSRTSIDVSKVGAMAAAHLADATVEIAALYAQTLAGHRLPPGLPDELRRLRKDNSPLASAFDSAYSR